MKAHHPQVSVKLIKVINRGEIVKGMSAADRLRSIKTIQLDQYLGDTGGVYTNKSPSQPAGAFSVILADRVHPDYMESLYGMIEPMDLIEIRMARDPWVYGGDDMSKAPIIMRGFVSDVRREEAIGQDGRPIRRVTVSGQDYGKILQILQVVYLNNSAIGLNNINGYPLLQKYKIDTSNNPTVQKFLEMVVKQIIDSFVQSMPWADSAAARPFARLTPVSAGIEGKVSGPLINQWPGNQPIFALMAYVCDVSNGFNELFAEDRESDVAIVLRPAPFIGGDGKLIDPADKGWFAPETTVTDEDIVSIQSGRTDENVANLFWVRNPHWALTKDGIQRLASQIAVVEDNPNCAPNLYGVRALDWTTNVGSEDALGGDAPSAGVMRRDEDPLVDQLKKRLKTLQDGAQNSVLFESGVMRLKGNENIRAGTFINVVRNGITSRVYADSVTQEFVPFQRYQTIVRFSRGTGWINRNKSGVKDPYWSELNIKGAY